jgi:nickel-dependent lactate racemase
LKTWLAYGKTGINVDLINDNDIHVISPTFVKGLSNPVVALRESLRDPISSPALRNMNKPGGKVGIVFSDITRPAPNTIILPAILAELDHLSPDNIVLFDALGTHRQNSIDELRRMIGDDLFEKYRIVQNDAFNRSTQFNLGQTSRGHDIWLNQELLSCDVKILTGFIEPHLFAGYSGGGKAIMPGMAGQETVLGNHDAGMISDPKAIWGVTNGNPIWEEIHEIADKIEGIFLVNVTLNKNKEITAVFAGKLREAHSEGCDFVRKNAMVAVDQPFDIVITSNSGYPLDLNLYQSIKGVSAAAQVVKDGGSIIIVAECWDGIPEHGLYGELLREVKSPKELLANIFRSSETRQDQWQAQIQAQIQLKSDIYVYSDNLDDDQITNAMMKPCRNIENTVNELKLKYGENTRICVLPEGPQTVPYVQDLKK